MNTPNLLHTKGSRTIAIQDLSDFVLEMIQQQIARLTQEYPQILNCQVNAAVSAFCQEGSYQIQIVLTLPDRNLTIEREPTPDYYQEDIYVSIWSAFNLARKKLHQLSSQTNTNVSNLSTPESMRPPIRGWRRCVGYAGA